MGLLEGGGWLVFSPPAGGNRSPAGEASLRLPPSNAAKAAPPDNNSQTTASLSFLLHLSSPALLASSVALIPVNAGFMPSGMSVKVSVAKLCVCVGLSDVMMPVMGHALLQGDNALQPRSEEINTTRTLKPFVTIKCTSCRHPKEIGHCPAAVSRHQSLVEFMPHLRDVL